MILEQIYGIVVMITYAVHFSIPKLYLLNLTFQTTKIYN